MPGDFIENYERVLGERGRLAGGGQVEFHCPFPGCEGYPKRKFRVDAGSGLWNCMHCNHQVPGKEYRAGAKGGHGGNWREFVRLMGDDPTLWPTGTVAVRPERPPLPLPRARAIWESLIAFSPLFAGDQAALLERGIDGHQAGYVSADPRALARLVKAYGRETVARAGLGYVDREGTLRPTRCVQPGRLLIPHYTGERLRWFIGYMRCPPRDPGQSTWDYQQLTESWAKTAGPLGYPPQLYGTVPPGAPLLLVTEGQLKAEAARQRGFPIVGLPGMGQCHAELAARVKAAGVERVFLLFDRQLEDQEAVDWAQEQLARQLLEAGAAVFPVQFPLVETVDGGRKMDVDSFLAAFGTGALADLIRAAARRPYQFA